MFIFRATDLVSFCDKILITLTSFCLQKNGGLSVPQFGAWDSKNPVPTNYSMVFTRARANRKQHKSDVRHASLGNERELLAVDEILRFLICYLLPCSACNGPYPLGLW